jgi:hypothetical protein
VHRSHGIPTEMTAGSPISSWSFRSGVTSGWVSFIPRWKRHKAIFDARMVKKFMQHSCSTSITPFGQNIHAARL